MSNETIVQVQASVAGSRGPAEESSSKTLKVDQVWRCSRAESQL